MPEQLQNLQNNPHAEHIGLPDESSEHGWMPVSIEELTGLVQITNYNYRAVTVNAEAKLNELRGGYRELKTAGDHEVSIRRQQLQDYVDKMDDFIAGKREELFIAEAEIAAEVGSADTDNNKFSVTGNELAGELAVYKELVDKRDDLYNSRTEKEEAQRFKKIEQAEMNIEATVISSQLEVATQEATVAGIEMNKSIYQGTSTNREVRDYRTDENNKHQATKRKSAVEAKLSNVRSEIGQLAMDLFSLESDLRLIQDQSLPTVMQQIEYQKGVIIRLRDELVRMSQEIAEHAERVKPQNPPETQQVSQSQASVSGLQSKLPPRVLDLIPEDEFKVSAPQRFGRVERIRINKISSGSN